jgi:hypothetical protein
MDKISKELAIELLDDINDLTLDQLDMDTNAEIKAIVKMLKEYINY